MYQDCIKGFEPLTIFGIDIFFSSKFCRTNWSFFFANQTIIGKNISQIEVTWVEK